MAVGLAFLEITAGVFLGRQKAVALGTVVDEAGFERRLDARDATFVDVAFFLFASRRLDIKILKLLSIDNGHAQLLALRGIDQNAFHVKSPVMRSRRRRWTRPGSGARSEEHTSELQSLMRISYAVFCLQKKK